MTSFEGEVTLRRRRLWVYALWEAALFGGLFALVTHNAKAHDPLLATYLGLAVLGLSWSGWTMTDQTRSKKPVHARIDEKGVWLAGKLAMARGHIIGGAHLRPREKGEIGVRIPGRGFGNLDIDVDNAEDGRAILAALGQDPAHVTTRFRLMSGFENKTLRTFATIVIGVSSSCGGIVSGQAPVFHLLFALWLVAGAIAGLSFLLPTHVTVGADGIFVEKRGRRRFVPFARVRLIDDDPKRPDAVILALHGEPDIVLRTSVQDRENSTVVSDVTRALRERLHAALTAFRAQRSEEEASLHLKRGSRSAREWIDALESARKTENYRVAPITDEQLWRVLEDPAASPEDRAAALVALRSSLDETGKNRQRVAIEACAEPRLRVVYEAALKEDEAELESALEQLHETS